MTNNNILLVGGNGLIANRLKYYFLSHAVSFVGTTRAQNNENNEYYLDLGGQDNLPDEVILNHKNVLLMAGITSPDECEKNYESSYRVNVSGTKKFIARCLKLGARVTYFSSDAVYGKVSGSASEGDELKPLGRYGQMKMEVEKNFSCHDNFKVLRLSYVLGPNDRFISYLRQSVEDGSVAHVFSGFDRSVVWIDDVIDVVIKLISEWNNVKDNIINVGGATLVGRDNIASLYKKYVDSNLEYVVEEPPVEFFRHRPRKMAIDISAMTRLLGKPPCDIEKVISEI